MLTVGWSLASLLLGVILGAVAIWRWGPRPVVAAPVPRDTEQPPPPVSVVAPPEPEELAQALIRNGAEERMVADFVENEGLSPEDAQHAADEILDRLQRMGAEESF